VDRGNAGSWLIRWLHPRRRELGDHRIQFEEYFWNPYWRERHELYLRVVGIISLTSSGGDEGVHVLRVKEALFRRPGQDRLCSASLVTQALHALRADGLVRRVDNDHPSLMTRYALTRMGSRFLGQGWVQALLDTYAPLVPLESPGVA
jgi:hypothetical protein